MAIPTPTLLVFARNPAEESARKRLLPERFGALGRDLFDKTLASALAAGRARGCRLEVSSTHSELLERDVLATRQCGRSFGERFRGSVSEAWSRSDGPLVVVGSDIPELTDEHIGDALERLSDHRDRVVLGPSPDGGFYLLASNLPLDAELAEVRWCRSDTLATLVAALERSGFEVSLLAPLRDLDRAQDLAAWARRHRPSRGAWQLLAASVRELLATLSRPLVTESRSEPTAGYALAFAGRGPPR